MLPRWVDGVEREALIRPVGEQVTQLSLPQQSRHRIFHHLHDSIACQAETVHRDDVADDDTTICGNLYDSSATMEFPFERTPGLRVAIVNQDMSALHEIQRRGRMLVPFYVRGRSLCGMPRRDVPGPLKAVISESPVLRMQPVSQKPFTAPKGVFLMTPPNFDPEPGFPQTHKAAAAIRHAIETSRPGKARFSPPGGAHVW